MDMTILGKYFWVDLGSLSAPTVRNLGNDHIQWLLDQEDPHRTIKTLIHSENLKNNFTAARHYSNLYRALQSTKRRQSAHEIR